MVDIHLIGHAHLDPVWLWRWQEGFAEVRATFRSALDRMTEFPEFVFTCSSAAIYEWIEENDPAMFAEIEQRVYEKRWQITGGWWVQADCNLPCGESLVRQALQGQRYFRQRFGVQCRCGFCVDSFGHSAGLPKILAGCGLDGWVWMRPQPHENASIPEPYFWWEAGDGSCVLALRISGQSYLTRTVPELEQRLATLQQRYEGTDLQDAVLCFFGVGNHGGGPTIAQLNALGEWGRHHPDVRLLHSSPSGVAERIAAKELPSYCGEMQHHASGCYAAVSDIKTWNRQAESALLTAEAWAAAAWMAVGKSPPTAALARSWKHVLFNQFHDIIAGTSIREAYEDARHQLGAARHAASVVTNSAQQAIFWNTDTRGNAPPVAVFNNTPFPFHGAVETGDFGFLDGGGVFVDEHGRRVPSQPITPHSHLGPGGAGRHRAVLHLALPALGCRVLRVAPADSGTGNALPPCPVTGHPNGFSNGILRVEVAADGSLALTDLRSGSSVLGPGAGIPLALRDTSDTWSHGVSRFDDDIGQFECTAVELSETGPVRGAIQVVFRFRDSALRLRYSLAAGADSVRVDADVDWRERWTMVKLPLAVRCQAESHTSEVPFEVVGRPNSGDEEPTQRWVDLSGPGLGLTVLNNARHSYDVRDNTIRVTVLRSPVYAHHQPADLDSSLEYHVTDQGQQRFSLVLVPHAGDWTAAGIPARADLLHRPPNVIFGSVHPGEPPNQTGMLTCSNPSVRVAALKPSEDGDCIVLRALECVGRETEATFGLPCLSREWTAVFRPWQVRTFGVPLEPAGDVVDLDMLEQRI